MENGKFISNDKLERVTHVIRYGQRLTRATSVEDIYSIYNDAISPYVDQKHDESDYDVVSELGVFMQIAIKNAELIKSLSDRVEVLRHLSYRDTLTGLFNRRAYEELFEKNEEYKKENIAIIVGDVNRLKKINDLHGHMVGDAYLKAIAKIIRKNSENNKVFRLGGDEFCLVVQNASEVNVAKIIYKIQRDCTMMQVHDESLSIALGYAFNDESCDSFGSVFACAESRMYKEKSNFHKVI
ncbi:MAG: GGDEF domain-containing protein [Clostridia bacterium]|nr:GGDEF domain-containing protein [Clostridia bacterium]